MDLGLKINNCGGECCLPGHTYGPAIRDHYLIHFVASGNGKLRTNEGEYSIGPGQGFIIFPDEITVYSADETDPWSYDWVGYYGPAAPELTQSAGLDRDRRVFELSDPTTKIRLMRDISSDKKAAGESAAIGALMRLMGYMAAATRSTPNISPSRRHYDRARWFMDGHYAQPITVQDVAEHVGLSRSQLFRVFDQCEGASPKAVLTALRLRHACRLLTDTDMTVEEIAQQVGMASAQRLGVIFRNELHTTPSQYRQTKRKQMQA